MANRGSALTPDEQARLDRFLEWRRVEGRERRPRWRLLAYMTAPMLIGAIIALGVSFYIGALTLPPGLTRGGVVALPGPVTADRTPGARSVSDPLARVIQTLTLWAQHAPNVKLGRAIVRWVQSQTLADAPAQADARPTQPGSPPSR